MLGEYGLYVADRACKQCSALIREPGQEASDRARREFAQVRRNHAPRALHDELHQDGSEHEKADAGSVRPEER